MKNMKQLEREKFEASEDNRYQGLITEQVDIELRKGFIIMTNENNNRTTISTKELILLLKELEEPAE